MTTRRSLVQVQYGPPFFSSLRMQAAIFIFQRFPGFSMLTAPRMYRYIRLRKLDEQGKPAKEEEASDLIKDPRIQEAYLGKK